MASRNNPIHRLFGIDVKLHGGHEKPFDADEDAKLQVIGLGQPRTGTTSLSAALIILGFAPAHQSVDLFRQPPRREAWTSLFQKVLDDTWKAGDPELNERLHELFKGYRSSTDLPPPFIPHEMYAAFKDAKFVLGARSSKEAWWTSMWNAVRPAISRGWDRTIYQITTYPVSLLRRTDLNSQLGMRIMEKKYGVPYSAETYDIHRATIKDLIPEAQLLEYDVKEGWEPLCKFLEVPVPDVPFPRLNEAEKMQAMWIGFQLFGVVNWCIYFGGAAGLVYMASHPQIAKEWLGRGLSWVVRVKSSMMP